MNDRIAFTETSPELFSLLMRTEDYLKKTTIPIRLAELIKYRVSQINGCAYCLDMHHKEAISHGETELRLHTLLAWRECHYYSEQERVVLEFAEVLTLISEHEVTEAIFDKMRGFFSKQEIVDMVLLVSQINLWNRFMKVYATTPGNYKVKRS